MFRTLTAGDFDAVVACFNEAFSDYAVRFSRDEGIDAFLRAGGAEQFIRQREMARPL